MGTRVGDLFELFQDWKQDISSGFSFRFPRLGDPKYLLSKRRLWIYKEELNQSGKILADGEWSVNWPAQPAKRTGKEHCWSILQFSLLQIPPSSHYCSYMPAASEGSGRKGMYGERYLRVMGGELGCFAWWGERWGKRIQCWKAIGRGVCCTEVRLGGGRWEVRGEREKKETWYRPKSSLMAPKPSPPQNPVTPCWYPLSRDIWESLQTSFRSSSLLPCSPITSPPTITPLLAPPPHYTPALLLFPNSILLAQGWGQNYLISSHS